MLIPIFVLGLILWLVIARCLLRLVKHEQRKRVWRWFLIITIFICTADQIVGMIYAHIWVAMAQGKPSMSLHTDELVAFQNVLEDKSSFPKKSILFGESEKSFLLTYKKFQIIIPNERDSDVSNFYEIELTNNQNDPACKIFYASPKTEKEMNDWFLKDGLIAEYLLENWVRIASAISKVPAVRPGHCIAVRPIVKLSARYLEERFEEVLENPKYPIPLIRSYEFAPIIKITDLKMDKVLCENRRVIFWGGWVFRFFFIDTEGSGKPLYYPVEKKGSCSIEPATRDTYETKFES